MIVKRGVAQFAERVVEFPERADLEPERYGNLDGLAEVEGFEGVQFRLFGMGQAKVLDDAQQVGAQTGERNVVPNVQRGHFLGQPRTVARRKDPLREVVREALRQEMVPAQALVGVVEDRGVARTFQVPAKLGEIRSLLVSDTRQVGGGVKLEGVLGGVHAISPSKRSRKRRTSAGPRKR